MKKNKLEQLEKEYEALEETLPELNPNEVVDSLSEHNCLSCGARLTKQEWNQCEDSCEECLYTDTAGLIDDDATELDFD